MKRIIYTGIREVDKSLVKDIEIYHFPILRNEKIVQKEKVDFHHFQWVWFTSSFGVDAFFGEKGYLAQYHFFFKWEEDKLELIDSLTREKYYLKIGVIGLSSQKRLSFYGLKSHFIPQIAQGEIMARQWLEKNISENILLAVGRHASHRIEAQLDKVHRLEIYEARLNQDSKRSVQNCMVESKVEGVLLTSSLGVDYLEEELLELQANHPTVDILAIGQTTLNRLNEKGIKGKILGQESKIETHINVWKKRG